MYRGEIKVFIPGPPKGKIFGIWRRAHSAVLKKKEKSHRGEIGD